MALLSVALFVAILTFGRAQYMGGSHMANGKQERLPMMTQKQSPSGPFHSWCSFGAVAAQPDFAALLGRCIAYFLDPWLRIERLGLPRVAPP
jgi:hypothetical protein